MGILDKLLGTDNIIPESHSSARWHGEPPPWAVVLHKIEQHYDRGSIRDDLFLIKQLNGGWWYLSDTNAKPLASFKSFAYQDQGWSWNESDVLSYEIMEHPFTFKFVKADTIDGVPILGTLLDFDQDNPDEALVVKTTNGISCYVMSESIRLAF